MHRMSNVLKSFDIYGDYFNLRINSQSKFKSLAGGVLSIITLFIMIFCFISFGKDFYLRKNPKVNKELGYYNNTSIPTLNGSEYSNKTIVLFYLKEYDTSLKPQIQQLTNNSFKSQYLSICSDDFLSSMDYSITKNEKEKYVFYCVKLNDFTIISGKSNFLGLLFSPCNLIPDAEIKKTEILSNCVKSNKTITTLALTFLTEKIGFSPDNKYPFIKKYYAKQNIVTNLVNTQISISLQINYLYDDIGLIMENIVKTIEISIDYITSIQTLASSSQYPLFGCSFFVSDEYVIYHRFYSKLQDLLASVGGFMKLIMTILNLFNLIIRSYLIDWYIIDNYLKYCQPSSTVFDNTKPSSGSNSLVHNNTSNNKSKYI
jgi:hypothetical protein